MIEAKIVKHKEVDAVIVGVITSRQDEVQVKEYLDELEFLAETAGATIK